MIRLLCLVIILLIAVNQKDLPAQEPSADVQIPAQPARHEVLAAAREAEAAKKFDQAAHLYREYLNRRPEDDEVRALLARVLSWQDRHKEAMTLYQDILSRHPVDMDVRVAVARVRSWQQRFEEAIGLYTGVLNEDPKNIEAKQGLADTLYWSKRYQEALHVYREVYEETKDPEIAQRIQAVTQEITLSARAPVRVPRSGPAIPFRDYAKLGYSHYTYTDEFPDERNWIIEAAKPLGNLTLVGRVEPLNRFGLHDTPVSGELYSPLWQRAWGYLGASGAVNPGFVPNWTLGGEIFQGLGDVSPPLSPVEVSFGYRHMRFKSDGIDLLQPGLTMYLPFNLWLTEKIHYVPEQGSITLSSQLTWRPTDRLQLFASGGFGTSGERIVAVQDFTRVQTRTIQGGLIFPISQRFSGEALGFYEDRTTLYVRRGGTFNLIWHW
ncbi:MAG TPA: YaiO family outer membrane beta-barrel protein [Nitrospira sp.]|nr:YaiO family outer membrane beta-barrel protein [Nitrospira sp.]